MEINRDMVLNAKCPGCGEPIAFTIGEGMDGVSKDCAGCGKSVKISEADLKKVLDPLINFDASNIFKRQL